MLKIKGGRYGARLSDTQAVCAMMIVPDQVLTEAGHEYELTSGIEGEHQTASLHYPGHALDYTVRRKRLGFAAGEQLREAMSSRLGDDFDVTFNPGKNQFHVEWQMKRSLGKL